MLVAVHERRKGGTLKRAPKPELYRGDNWCLECGAELVETATHWSCSGCGLGGFYVEFEGNGKRLRARAVEREGSV